MFRLPGPTLHSGSITTIPAPFAQRFHQSQNISPAANSEYIIINYYYLSYSRIFSRRFKIIILKHHLDTIFFFFYWLPINYYSL